MSEEAPLWGRILTVLWFLVMLMVVILVTIEDTDDE